MDSRLYFVLGDLIANILCGAIIGAVCYLIFDPSWNMLAAMFFAMGVGMLASMLLWFPTSIVLGAMEAMLPMMLTGMYSGMVVGMWASMHPISLSMSLFVGGVVGLLTITLIWIANNQLRGVKTMEESR
ncbi:MAG: hypothetical protein AB8B48_01290 [Pseudomonadales bacterium]